MQSLEGPSLTAEDLNRIREWFNFVKDVADDGYLDAQDYATINKITDYLQLPREKR